MPTEWVTLTNAIKKMTSPLEKFPKALSDLVNALNRTAKAIEDYNRLERSKQAHIQVGETHPYLTPRPPDGMEHT